MSVENKSTGDHLSLQLVQRHQLLHLVHLHQEHTVTSRAKNMYNYAQPVRYVPEQPSRPFQRHRD